MFLKRPNETQEMVQKMLHKATEESDYLDLLHAVMLAEKSDRSDDTCALEPSVTIEMLAIWKTEAHELGKVELMKQLNVAT
ncbi:hypothetical protein KXD40_007768 [Peronospora effusa]|uniref:Uncharacterized protein n=1 Tax=Peronospora effusa TaxID=542832 RepID=A0A3M6VTZ3_9STRA|nr:hypothetical protein DD238_001830 [Peronospora effusa]UIZ23405.1 hypothetical protein KXD40_007768 [Peronospora effusa]